jgi:hypothetical protein
MSMPTETGLFLVERFRACVAVASSELMIQWYMLAIAVLALGFVTSEVTRLLRTERAEFNKAKSNGADTWRKRVGLGYIVVCAAGEICHRIVMVSEAYYS